MNSKNQQSDGLSRRQGFMPLGKLFHKDEVRGAFGQSDYRMAVRIYYRIYLPVSETCAVSFSGMFVHACAVCNICSFCRRNVPLFQPFHLNLGIK